MDMDRPTPEQYAQMPPELRAEIEKRLFEEMIELAERMRELHDAESRDNEEASKLMVEAGLVTPDDLRMMLRGQVLLSEGDTPVCCRSERFGARYVRQLWALPPDRPIEAAPNELLCPLHERYLDDQCAPCGRLYDNYNDLYAPTHWPRPSSPQEVVRQECARVYFHDTNSAACQMIVSVAENLLEEQCQLALDQAGAAAGGAAATPAALAEWGQRLAQEPVGDPMTSAQAGERLRYLVATKRMDLRTLGSMLSAQLAVTDQGWLSCKDDKMRTKAYMFDESNDGWKCLCDLQERGKLGDRTVPCCEALREKPDPRYMAISKERRSWGLFLGGPKESALVDRGGELLPVSWSGPADEPGGPKDPVRLMQLRPCYLIGRFLYDELPRRLAG